jgi:hypothetical protein
MPCCHHCCGYYRPYRPAAWPERYPRERDRSALAEERDALERRIRRLEQEIDELRRAAAARERPA